MLLNCHSVTLPLFLVATSGLQSAAGQCLHSASVPDGLTVNCTSLNLTALPHLPPDTAELYVQANQLSFVPAGLFDRLLKLSKVNLSDNPFHCDCRIRYLRNWLLRNRAKVVKTPVCATPGSVAQTAITQLDDGHFSACVLTRCADWKYNAVLGGMLCCLLALLLGNMILARRSTFTLLIDDRHQGLEADSLRSLKPRNRKRLHVDQRAVREDSENLCLSEDVDRPLIKHDRPQLLDVLQKKHQIKVKAT